jgi:hypothetical protein
MAGDSPVITVAFDHPVNAAVLRHLGRNWDESRPGNRSAGPEVFDLFRNSLGTHPDLADRLWKQITVKLPVSCAWVVYGRPVLVHPDTGIVFAFAGGTHAYALRLPEKERQEALAAGAKRVWHYTDATWDLDDLGAEWIFGGCFQQEQDWCLAAYGMAGDP